MSDMDKQRFEEEMKKFDGKIRELIEEHGIELLENRKDAAVALIRTAMISYAAVTPEYTKSQHNTKMILLGTMISLLTLHNANDELVDKLTQGLNSLESIK